MTPEEEDWALNFDPWAGDMDSDAVTMRDQFVRTRQPADCAICFEAIPVGARVRSQTQRSEEQRKVMTFKFCVTCCELMASSHRDNDERIEDRYALGQRNAQKSREATA